MSGEASGVSKFSREEIEAAWEQYKHLGVGTHDWEAWADLFTDDALYVEHFLGTFTGREAIKSWIVSCMAEYPSMTLWMEWSHIEDDKVVLYIWNNLPDPTGTGKRYGFPNTTALYYAGDGKWNKEEDFYNPADAERVWAEWFADGGRLDTPPDPTLKGIDGWAPEPSSEVFPREEIEAEFVKYQERGSHAVATGDWDQWADQFTDDARYLEHHYGKFEGQDAIRAWITDVMGPFPEMFFPVTWHVVDGNRVVALVPNCLPDPTGGDTYYGFDVFVILHYAGNGKWSYEEDVYNPKEAEACVAQWVNAGGVLPGA